MAVRPAPPAPPVRSRKPGDPCRDNEGRALPPVTADVFIQAGVAVAERAALAGASRARIAAILRVAAEQANNLESSSSTGSTKPASRDGSLITATPLDDKQFAARAAQAGNLSLGHARAVAPPAGNCLASDRAGGP